MAMVCIVVAAPAFAQQAPDTKPAAPAPATPPAAAPAPATPPAAAPTPAAPPAGGAEAPKTEAPKAEAPKSEGTTLPPVQIIQEKPKPAPKKEAAPAPKKKPAVAAPAAPAAPAQTVTTAPATSATPPAAAPASTVPPESVEAGFVKMSPLGGELPIEKVPGGVATVSAKDIERTGAVTVQEALQTRVPGVIIGDIQGNAFQTDVQYRGFTSSPVNGQPQGLAIYQNGVRINEVWGDTVNWEFLPSNAINDLTIMSNNPVFGLNAIGGALSIGMKDGFLYQGAEIDGRIGSFGRRQLGIQAGQKSGSFAGYAAFETIHDSGWRDFSPTNIQRMYADIGAKGSAVEMHLNYTGAVSKFGAVTAAPVELLDLRWANTYTSPQVTKSEVDMVSLNGTVTVTPTLKLSGLGYYRNFKQRRVDGNITDFEECNNGVNDFLCLDGDPTAVLLDGAGNPIDPAILNGSPAGSLDRTTTQTDSFGGSAQAVEKSKLFGLGNQFLIGGSYDHGKVAYTAASELGTIGPQFVISPTGISLTAPADVTPRSLTATTNYYGLYFTDTFDVTDRLSITGGGRYNVAQIDLQDQTGNFPELTGSHTYSRFNPMIGATCKVFSGLSFYGGYSEANRAPTPVELACSNPDKPCIIESFLTADPELNQVVSHTYEAGLRGELGKGGPQRLDWSFGFFHTLNTDDIIDVASPTTGRGYFTNAGATLRQGVEAAINYREDRFSVYANYSFVDATFRNALELASPNNPSAIPCSADPTAQCINVTPGNRLPSVPAHKLKAGFDYWLTKQWRAGADIIVTSDQFFRGDEANQNAKLPGYERVDLHTSYDITPNVQLYGHVQNLFDNKYGLYGTYFNTAAATNAANGAITFTDPRTITPAQPFAVYGGLKVKF